MAGKDTRPSQGTLLRGIFDSEAGNFETYYALLDEMHVNHFFESREKLEDELRRKYNENASGTIHLPKDIDSKSRINETMRNYQKWLFILIHKYNIPASFFPDADKVLNEEDMKPKSAEAYNLNKNAKEAHHALVNVHYKNLNSELLVLDNLERQSFDIALHLQDYLEANADCFKEINDAAKKFKNKFQYIRIMSLPSDYSYEGKKEYQILKDAVDHASLPLFKHICDYLEMRKDWQPNQDKPKGFFVPIRRIGSQHFALMNNGEVIITEAGAFDKSGTFLPMWLYIEQPGPSDKVKYKRYRKLVLSVINEYETLELNDLVIIKKCAGELVEEAKEFEKDTSLRSMDNRKTLKHAEIRQQKLDYIESMTV